MKTKKVLTTVVIVLVALVLIIVVGIALFGGKMVKAGVEIGASSALDVPVTLGNASLSLFAGKLELNDLQINNPPGFEHEKLLTMGLAHVNVSLSSLMSDTVEIQDMILHDVSLVIEQKGLKTNLQMILDSLPKTEKEPADKGKPAKNLKIVNLEIKGVQVKAKFLPIPGKSDTVTFKLAPITMTNVGSDDKMTVAKLTGKILVAIAKGVAAQGGDLLPKEILGPMMDITGGAVDAGKEAIKQATDIGGEAAGTIKKGIEGVGEGIKGIFGDKKKE